MRKDKKILFVYIPEQLEAKIIQEIKKTGCSRTWLVIKALEQYLNKK